MSLRPINFKKWIDEHRHLLKPPVGNQQVWADREFMVTVVGGPNSRTDYHINEGEEFFYQIEGDIVVRVLVDGKPEDIPIREGEIFLLPPHVPHSPQRGAGTVGLVLERRRLAHELDSFLWVCKSCHAELWKTTLNVKDIVQQLPPIFEQYYSNPSHLACRSCGTQHEGRRK
jgi:3-hydroxyanthranilate 3,4-dioxygenase